MLVDRISGVLNSSPTDDGRQEDEEFQMEDDEKMSDDEEDIGKEDLGDLMTLSQYQDEARREALV